MISKRMEKDKYYALVFFICTSIAYMRIALSGIYIEVALDKMMAFSTPKPYVYRVLMPLIVNAIYFISNIPYVFILFFIELLTIIGIYFATCALLKRHFSYKTSHLWSLLFIIILSLVFLVNYRYSLGKADIFYYPYDTSAVLLTLLGMLLVLKQRWLWLFALVTIATLNRESSILIILLLPALYLGSEIAWKKPFVQLLFLYTAIRVLICYIFRDSPGSFVEITHIWQNVSHLATNMKWLLDGGILMFAACLAFIPLFWWAFSNYIPEKYSRIKFIALAYVIGLFFVGNIIESRLFGEVVALLYLPTVVGIMNWSNNVEMPIPGRNNIIDDNGVTIIFTLFLFSHLWIEKLLAYFHGPY